MADIARQLETAYRNRDLGLLGSLLHPQVQWTGLCANSEQVIDWYRGLIADGTVADIDSVEVDRDAVVLGLAVARKAEGARPAAAQHLYQVFTVDGTQVIDIRGYPDRHSAVTRAPAVRREKANTSMAKAVDPADQSTRDGGAECPAIAARLLTATMYGLLTQGHLRPGSFFWPDAATVAASSVLGGADDGGAREPGCAPAAAR